MGTPGFEMIDPQKTVDITSAPLGMCDSVMTDLVTVLNTFNTLAPLASITSNGLVSTITLKDARTATYTLNYGATPPGSITFQVTSAAYWSGDEFDQIQQLAQFIVTLYLQYELTNLSITYN
jgi:hypothetical protein